MGILISRFRKKKTTIEILEDLDKKIKEIEQYGQSTEQRHKRIVGMLILYSVALYTITAIVFYFYFFPASLYDQLFYIIPLLMFPLLILFTKKMVSWYYKRKISRNQEKLDEMQKQKKQILEDVTETETYKKAKEILSKFAPDQLRSSVMSLSPQPYNSRLSLSTSVQSSTIAPQVNSDTPRRMPAVTPAAPNVSEGSILRRRALTSQSMQVGSTTTSAILPYGGASGATSPPPMSSYPPANRQFGTPVSQTHNPLPRPILPQQRSYIDKLVEYLVGDGPSNRYALICRQCESHNGMALKEEFEYFAFRCCYCNFWNPARKQKPSAPKLELDQPNINHYTSLTSEAPPNTTLDARLSISKSDNSINLSESDSDIEVVEKPHENEEENDERLSGKSDEDGSESGTKTAEPAEDKMEIDESASQ